MAFDFASGYIHNSNGYSAAPNNFTENGDAIFAAAWLHNQDTNTGTQAPITVGTAVSGTAAWGIRCIASGAGFLLNVFHTRATVQLTYTTTTVFSVATWYHFLITLDADVAAPRLFVDGVEDTTWAALGVAGSGAFQTGADSLVLGANMAASGAFLDGKMAEWGIWNTNFATARGTQQSNRIVPIFRPHSLCFYMPMHTNIQDLMSANTFTSSGVTVDQPHPRVYKPSSALRSRRLTTAVATGQPMMRRWGGVPWMYPGRNQLIGRSW